MIRDKLGTYAEGQTAATDGTQIGDYIDHSVAGYLIGGGQAPKYLNIVVSSAFTSGGADNEYTFKLEVDSESGFATDNKSIITYTVPAEDLVKGYMLELPIPATGLKYSHVTSNESGTVGTPGTLDAFITY